MALFSVIMPTRNRPALFREALDSVLAQSFSDIEIIVVNDGSAAEHQPAYESILGELGSDRVNSYNLVSRTNGHGSSYAHNFGAAAASGQYLCSLDDDDCWTDPDHLGRAAAAITDSAAPVDLYLSNQAAFLLGERQPGAMWLDNLAAVLAKGGNRPDRHGVHTVTIEELLQSNGFCHLNTMIVRRDLYQEIGGMDESNRWAHDLDLYLRLIDRATVIKYAPFTVARHNVPDPTKTMNITTVLSMLDRQLYLIQVYDRAILFGHHPGIRAYGRATKGNTLKRITEALAAAGRHGEAAFYAREALGAGPTVKWAGYTGWRALRAISAALSHEKAFWV